jgi:hypothetical protein
MARARPFGSIRNPASQLVPGGKLLAPLRWHQFVAVAGARSLRTA